MPKSCSQNTMRSCTCNQRLEKECNIYKQVWPFTVEKKPVILKNTKTNKTLI